MYVEIFAAVSILVALGWVPILLKFYRAWKQRHNPVSLAIGGVILLAIYSNVVTVALYAFQGSQLWSAAAICGFNVFVCINFYLAVRWSQRHFPEERHANEPRP